MRNFESTSKIIIDTSKLITGTLLIHSGSTTGKCLFLINEILLQWVRNKSDIEGVGILDPGPISNYNLFYEDGTLKYGLVKGKDYRLVNENVWNALYDIYSGVTVYFI